VNGYGKTNHASPQMYEPVAPIFVFADDLGVFASIADAEQQYEPWIAELIEVICDAKGEVLRFDVGGRAGVTITPDARLAKEYDAFVDRLRDRLLRDADVRPDLLNEQWVRTASGEELIAWCADRLMLPPSNPPMQ
jgi:hypothetical protein